MAEVRVTVHRLQALRDAGTPIVALTCYDASFARLLATAGVDVLLVGDSLGMVVQGRDSTLGVSVADTVYHVACVAAASGSASVLADLPFGSYQGSAESAFAAAAKLMSAGAHMVKLEGGTVMAPTVAFLSQRGVPVCGHIGLTPQSVHQLGGYRVQGRDEAAVAQLVADALALEAAGARMLVLETVPAPVGRALREALTIPLIGCGAGPDCDGQVLVLHDMLGITPPPLPRFVRDFTRGAESVDAAVTSYVQAVRERRFPSPEECYP